MRKQPVTPLLGINPKEVKTGYRKYICTPMLIAAFHIAKIWKPPECLSVGEWIKKTWYTQSHITSQWGFVLRNMLLGDFVIVKTSQSVLTQT